jgi:hypothetical protein
MLSPLWLLGEHNHFILQSTSTTVLLPVKHLVHKEITKQCHGDNRKQVNGNLQVS